MWLLFKNSVKKIFKSFGRFISISTIILIGIGVFVGLQESTPGMIHTVDNYYDTYKLMDYKITSTYGLDQNDIIALENLENVEKVIPTYSLDILTKDGVVRLHAMEKDVNNVFLLEGRSANNKEECLGDYKKYQIGDKVEFQDATNLNIKKCVVVGLIKSPLYINNTYGISNIGNGELTSFLFVPKEAFNLEYYTEAYLIARDSVNYVSYEEDYQKSVKKLKDELIKLKPIRETLRYEEVLQSAKAEIAKIQLELDEQINSNEQKLADSKKELDKNQRLLRENKIKALAEINANFEKLNNNKNNILTNLASLGIDESNISTNLSQLKDNIDNLKAQLSLLPEDSLDYSIIVSQINILEQNYQNLNIATESLSQINAGFTSLENEKIKLESEMQKQEQKLQAGYNTYYEGVQKLENAKKEAEAKIAEESKELENIPKPVWYLLDRSSNNGYQNYYDDALKVEAISKVLPVFFIIVVMLMCLNTLTRLIEEERGEIGILQSNGFSKFSVIASYLLYVFSSTLIGIILGLLVGYGIISKIIYGVFMANYNLPKYIAVVNKTSLSIIVILTLLIMLTVTIIACNKELKDKPAELLRPKAPKGGKSIFLEKFSKIWSRLSFMSKITIRNLFRYKKRIIMTILGVAGCTALLLTGFGLNDSINVISKIQYNEIIKYDTMVVLKEEVTNISKEQDELLVKNNIIDYLMLNQNSYTYSYDNKEETVYVIAPSNTEYLSKYINLKSTKDKKIVSIPQSGAIITSGMAEQLHVKKGDNIEIRNSDNELFIVNVANIVDNYISHYIYLSPSYYQEIFKKELKYNNIIAMGDIKSENNLNDYGIYMINSTKDIIETFDTFIKSINNLILLIIICACLLVFAVIYNLTIINVNERKREIATFKVLGFNNFEIFVFIYRETFILTILGIMLGLIMGVYLHHFVVATAQMGNVQFLYNIEWYSYIGAAIITIIFSLLVQLLVTRTINKIDMIDSLKSVE